MVNDTYPTRILAIADVCLAKVESLLQRFRDKRPFGATATQDHRAGQSAADLIQTCNKVRTFNRFSAIATGNL